MKSWLEICAKDEIAQEDLKRVDHAGKIYIVYRSPSDEYYCTDGLCTHEEVDLSTGFVEEHTIECPKHSARFDYTTGEVLSAPACINLGTYPVKIENDKIYIEV